MGYVIILLAGLMGFLAIAVVGRRNAEFASQLHGIPRHPASPLDEAERILAHRYARGDITPDEYTRMLAILKR